MERAYTVKEIDALRAAAKERFMWGTTKCIQGSCFSRSFRPNEVAIGTEELVRTYMLAGITAQDIYDADNDRSAL